MAPVGRGRASRRTITPQTCFHSIVAAIEGPPRPRPRPRVRQFPPRERALTAPHVQLPSPELFEPPLPLPRAPRPLPRSPRSMASMARAVFARTTGRAAGGGGISPPQMSHILLQPSTLQKHEATATQVQTAANQDILKVCSMDHRIELSLVCKTVEILKFSGLLGSWSERLTGVVLSEIV